MRRLVETVIERCGSFISGYEVLICDVWGVLYDGRTAYQTSNDTLCRYRKSGGRVVLLSNAARLPHEIAEMLDKAGVDREAYDSIVSSGELAVNELRLRKVRQVFHIGPDRHGPLLAEANCRRVDDPAGAEVVLCSGFLGDIPVSPEEYRPLLSTLALLDLPLICANPDLVVEVDGQLLPCPGALAKLYAQLGGVVVLAGKPDPSAICATLDRASKLTGSIPLRSKVLVVGDALATDIAGANAAGLDALFVGQGIHRQEVAAKGRIDPEALDQVFRVHGRWARAAVMDLSW